MYNFAVQLCHNGYWAIKENNACKIVFMECLSIPQWPHNNSCTGEHNVQLHIAGTNERKSARSKTKAICLS